MSFDYENDSAYYNYGPDAYAPNTFRKGSPTVASAYDLVFTPTTSKAEAIRQARQLLARAGVKADIIVKSPEWAPGDVVVIRYNRISTPYTYVRGSKGWPGERFNKTDDQITDLFIAGCAKPVLQSGGAPFDVKRLP